MTTFDDTYKAAYGFDVPSIEIGHVLREGGAAGELPVRVPLRMMNRHGMIAGSTGTGKTRTLQLFAEGLSRAITRTVVTSALAILALDFVLTSLMFRGQS